jgi:hypothetical protein
MVIVVVVEVIFCMFSIEPPMGFESKNIVCASGSYLGWYFIAFWLWSPGALFGNDIYLTLQFLNHES